MNDTAHVSLPLTQRHDGVPEYKVELPHTSSIGVAAVKTTRPSVMIRQTTTIAKCSHSVPPVRQSIHLLKVQSYPPMTSIVPLQSWLPLFSRAPSRYQSLVLQSSTPQRFSDQRCPLNQLLEKAPNIIHGRLRNQCKALRHL